MSTIAEKFLIDAEKKVFDPEHRRKLSFNIGQYDKKVVEGKKQYANLELARERAAALKTKAIENLDKYLIEFEANFIKRGGKVIWARDAKEAQEEIIKVLRRFHTKTVVKSKSMVTEEIHINDALEKEGMESLETDLGEFIVQMRKETPYHIVTPAMHLSKEDVAKTFHEEKGTPLDYTPQQITAWVRKFLREKYVAAEAGITGGNFLIADIGGVALTENEGNAWLSMAFPKVHIAIVGIEKIIPSLNDMELFWSLLATYGTGQNVTVYNSILTGPRQAGETDGPEEMYVVLLDNGRTNVLEQPEQHRSLQCIRCGACLNACPIYNGVGGHSYASPYSGPIGAVLTPQLWGMKEYKHLSYSSSLCGRCTEVCPVKIDLHNLLLYNRRDAVKEKLSTSAENLTWIFWKKAMMKRSAMEKGGAKLKNFIISRFFKKSWGNRRELPKVAPKSFNQIWREGHGMK
ncbi:MAG: iron-sulfur cluster-binding protein [Bacteroidetes bacterium]|nr:MAG: iron-sulfur cluster-binding protein [Bacteroidota bacterium]